MGGGQGSVATWTVVFTDIVGSTEWRIRVGEESFDHIRRRLDARLAGILGHHGANVVKSTGDGLMLGFGSTAAALRCAVAIQGAVAGPDRGDAEPVALRIGISVGDAAEEDGDLHGTAVVEAARLCAVAEGGTILCTGAVRTVSANRSGVRFGEGRTVELKGIPGRVTVHEVDWSTNGHGPTDRIRFGVLGDLRIERDGQPVNVGGPKERLVLALLLANANSTMSVEALIDQVWGADPPRTAERTMHAYIARLRKALDPGRDTLVTVGRGYRLEVELGQLDASRFEAASRDGLEQLRQGDPAGAAVTLAAGLAEWRGDAYGDFPDAASCAAEAARLAERRLATVEDRFDADLAAGRDAELVPELESVLAEHPFRERLWAHLMLALYRAGRQRDALDAFQRARTVLVDELGIEPGPELRRLEAAVLDQDRGLDRTRPVPTSGPGRMPLALDAVGPAFVGREREVGWLRQAWREAADGRGSFVSVLGPEGIGKTRLVAELAREVHAEGGAVLYGRCDHAHLGARSLIDVALRSGGGSVADVEGHTGTGLAAALARHLPAWSAGRPVLLVLDDLHQADAEALEVVADLATWSQAAALLVVGAFRSDAGPGGAEPAESTTQLVLGALDGAAVADICQVYEPEGWAAEEVRQLSELTGGVPLLVHEQASAWARAKAARRVEAATERLSVTRGRLAVSRGEVADGVEGIQRLLEQRRLQLAGREAQRLGEQVAALSACPYKGLARFEQADAANFFGRERLVADLVARLAGSNFLAVVGPSGTGKSSLVRAGLLPALAAGVLADPDEPGWATVLLCPGRRPLTDLEAALGRADRSGAPLAVFVDQFEETFTLAEPEERTRFLDRLVELAGEPDVSVVLAVRADHLGRCVAHPGLAALLDGNDVLVGPMREAELRRTVELPAQRAGLTLEPGLVDLIVGDVAGRAGALPLLSTALAETWERREQRTLTTAGYRAAGGVNGALARLAEDAYLAIPDTARPAARRMLLRLCDTGERGILDLRRRLPVGEVVAPGNEDAGVALEVLADTRLLIVDGDAVEIAHEAVLREWPRLRTWLEEDIEGRQLHGRLSAAAHAWADSGRDVSELYRGTRLAAAADFAVADPSALNPLERDFLDASQVAAASERIRAAAHAAERERTNKRLRRSLVALALLLVTALGAGVLAVQQRQRADDEAATAVDNAAAAQLRGLLGEAEALHATRRDLALLLAVEGHRLDTSVETGSALLGLLQDEPEFRGYARGTDPDQPYLELAFLDDHHVVAGDGGGGLTVFDLDTNRQVGDRVVFGDGRRPVAALATDPGLGLVAVGLSAQSAAPPVDAFASYATVVNLVQVDDLLAATGGATLAIRTLDLPDLVHDVAIGPTGQVVAGTVAGSAVLLPPGGAPVEVGVEGSGPVAVAFAPDGTLATGTGSQIRLWRGDPLAPVADVGRDDVGVDGALQFSTDGRFLASARAGSSAAELVAGIWPRHDHLMVWDLDSGTSWPSPAPALCLNIGVLGDRAYCVEASGPAQTFDLATGEPGEPVADLHVEGASGVAVSQDGRLLASSGIRTPLVASWHVDGGSTIAPVIDGPGSYPTGYRFDSRQLMVESGLPGAGFPIGERRLWDVGTRSVDETLDVLVAAYADGGRIAAVEAAGTPVVLLADGTSLPLEEAPPVEEIKNYAVDPTHGRLALGFADGRVLQWDLASGRPVGGPIGTTDTVIIEAADPAVDSLAYLRDGTLLTVAAGGRTRFFDTDSGAEVLEAVDGQSVAAPLTGGIFVTTRGDGLVTVYDASTGEPVDAPFQGGRARTNHMAVSDDGQLLMISSWDGTLRLFDIPSQTQIGRTLAVPFADPVTTHLGGALAPDGSQLAAATRSGVQLWDLDPEGWEATACRLAGRNLTAAEWERHLPGDAPYRATCPDFPSGE